jgi:hypothetical protein
MEDSNIAKLQELRTLEYMKRRAHIWTSFQAGCDFVARIDRKIVPPIHSEWSVEVLWVGNGPWFSESEHSRSNVIEKDQIKQHTGFALALDVSLLEIAHDSDLERCAEQTKIAPHKFKQDDSCLSSNSPRCG